MRELVTRVSPYGFQTKEQGPDVWLNTSKFAKGVTMDGVENGSTVEYEFKAGANGKRYLTKLSVVGAAAPSAAAEPAPQAEATSSSGASKYQYNRNGLSESSARANAVQAAFGPALEAFLSKAETVGDAVEQAEGLSDRLTRYILTGKFDEELEETHV